jgi:hypothetical protein
MLTLEPYVKKEMVMTETSFRKLTGIFFIVGAVLVNVPYTLLFVNFDYPDILRQPSAEILTKFHTGGDSLIYSWLAFAWVSTSGNSSRSHG